MILSLNKLLPSRLQIVRRPPEGNSCWKEKLEKFFSDKSGGKIDQKRIVGFCKQGPSHAKRKYSNWNRLKVQTTGRHVFGVISTNVFLQIKIPPYSILITEQAKLGFLYYQPLQKYLRAEN